VVPQRAKDDGRDPAADDRQVPAGDHGPGRRVGDAQPDQRGEQRLEDRAEDAAPRELVCDRPRAGVPGHPVGVHVGHEREAEADHRPVDHAVLNAVDLRAARGEQGEQDQSAKRLGDERAAERGAKRHGSRDARGRVEIRGGDRAGVQRATKQGGDDRDARSRTEDRGEQRPRLGLQPVQVQDEGHEQRERQQCEQQADQRRRRAALDHDEH
jgi:hypothetical protein